MTAAVLAGFLVALAVLVAPGAPGHLRMPSPPADLAAATERTGRVSGPPERAATPTTDDVTSALVLLALGYRSGLPTWEVLGAVAEVLARPEGPDGSTVARDLRQVAAALRWGATDEEAWASVGAVWSGAGRAVAIAHRAGIPPGPLLLSSADELRKASLERVELAAARVGVQLVAPLGLVLLPAFCLTTVVPLVVALGARLLTG